MQTAYHRLRNVMQQKTKSLSRKPTISGCRYIDYQDFGYGCDML